MNNISKESISLKTKLLKYLLVPDLEILRKVSCSHMECFNTQRELLPLSCEENSNFKSYTLKRPFKDTNLTEFIYRVYKKK